MKNDKWPSWVWWASGILLLLAYFNYSSRDDRPAPINATAGMTAAQVAGYQKCLYRNRGLALSDAVNSAMCRKFVFEVAEQMNCLATVAGDRDPDICDQ
jgi:hypothetical protein